MAEEVNGETTTQAGFRRLTIDDWRQFDSIDIEFHPRLTILTGANATGKSTILGILARHFNWNRPFSTAPMGPRSKRRWFSVGRRRARRTTDDANRDTLGSLVYGNGQVAKIYVPRLEQERSSQYDVSFENQQHVVGAFVTSHRSAAGSYVPIPSIPTSFAPAAEYFEQFTNEERTRWVGGWTGKSSRLVLKEALMSAAVFSFRDNPVVEYNEEAGSLWFGFQGVLRELMPRSLGYRGIRVRNPDLVIETETGDFIFDEASGGLSAILELAWSIFLRSRSQPVFTVLLDEPENHLHPSLQKELVPGLLLAFPQVQFIVATHSPFVVTATDNSSVYALMYNDRRRVEARRLDSATKAGSVDETLREVLGLETTTPTWAERAFESVMSQYPPGSLTEARLVDLRSELASRGLEYKFPTAVLRSVNRHLSEDDE